MTAVSHLAIDLREVAKSFGDFFALRDLNLQVRPGECFGLLGPNGAGKSTTLRLLLGLTLPDVGQIRVIGLPVPEQALDVRARVGVVPQHDALDPDFTVVENLMVFARYFGERGARTLRDPAPLLEFAGLAHKRDARIGELSGGMRRRLSLARALVNDPELLLLDEPTTGLDPQARHLIWERLRRQLALGRTILLTTHFLEEAERLCDRVAIVDHGRCIALDRPQALIAHYVERHVIEISRPPHQADAPVPVARAGERIEQIGDLLYVYTNDAALADERVRDSDGCRVLRRAGNLDDVFLKLTGRDLRD
jgi:lipooligosaccharide transport system ATP-binding protein